MSDKSVVLITGALTGIGRAAALAFAKEGASVVVSGRREVEGKLLKQSSPRWAPKRRSFARTCAMKTRCAI